MPRLMRVSTLARFAAQRDVPETVCFSDARSATHGIRWHESPFPLSAAPALVSFGDNHRRGGPRRRLLPALAVAWYRSKPRPPSTPPLAAVILVIAACSITLHLHRRRYTNRLCRRWGLDPMRVRVIASDLGRHRAAWSLRADGLVGNPDVLFRDRANGRPIVGEAKSRHYKGSVTPYERYQVTLYLGMVERLYRQPAQGGSALRQRPASSGGLQRSPLPAPGGAHSPLPAGHGLNAYRRVVSVCMFPHRKRKSTCFCSLRRPDA